MAGYDQAVRVTGSATVGGQRIAVDGLGQRGHSWGAPDWDKIALARTVGAWLDDDLAVSLTAIRPAGAAHHDQEKVAATILDRDADSDEPRATAVVEPRLSTTYDADGRQRRAGLELFVDEDGFPRRAAGEVRCGTTLDLGRLRLDCAFFRWRMEGRTGSGATTSWRRVRRGEPDRGRRQRLRRRAHDAAHRDVRRAPGGGPPRPGGDARRPAAAHGEHRRAPRARARDRADDRARLPRGARRAAARGPRPRRRDAHVRRALLRRTSSRTSR